MKQKLDIETWARKEHYRFFSQFEEPFYGVTVNIDCTIAYQTAKQKQVSFFLYYLYQALQATISVEPFRYRIENGEVVIYDVIHAGSTVGRANGTFGYGYLPYQPSLTEFVITGSKELKRVQNLTDLELSPAEDIIRFSALPWIDFTSLSHARMFAFKNSCPSISFGKMTEKDGKRAMPMSIHVHHALVDGRDIGLYVDRFQELMNSGI